jgi:hypothetical protein
MNHYERLRQRIDWAALGKVYLEKRALTPAQFDALVEDTIGVHRLNIQGLNWAATHQILSVHRQIPLQTHYEALSAALGFQFNGVEDFHKTGIRIGFLPPSSMNRTHFYQVPTQPMPIGELMLNLGLITQPTLQSALGIQVLIQDTIKTRVALGSVILSITQLSFPDFYQVLGIQAGVPYVNMDSAPRIFDTLTAQTAARMGDGMRSAVGS